MQRQYGISCCVLLSEMNNRHIPVGCEVDVGSAITMYALRSASGNVASCLDWNNNYADDDNKCILFHCGPVPQAMMTEKGKITDHAILANEVGKGCAFGCNVGRIKPGPFSFGNLITEEGKLKFYLGEAKFTDDPIPPEFFGCAGVAESPICRKRCIPSVLPDIATTRQLRRDISLLPCRKPWNIILVTM